jgi:hypothetical protein
MPCSTIRAVATIGIDMGKNTLHMIGLDSRGAIVLREKVSRNQMCGGARLVTGRITLLAGRLPHIAIDCPARTRAKRRRCWASLSRTVKPDFDHQPERIRVTLH